MKIRNESSGLDWLVFTFFSIVGVFLTFVVALLNLTNEDWNRKVFSASLFYDMNSSTKNVEISKIEKTDVNAEDIYEKMGVEEIAEVKSVKNVKRVVQNEVKGRLIDESFLIGAGFENVSVEVNGYNGWIFEDVDFNELEKFGQSVEDVFVGGEKVLTATWFKGENKAVLSEIYGLILLKYNQKIGASINETNHFGEKSFYVNFSGQNDTAFLVVKSQSSVYSLAYKKEIHGKVSKLIQFLNQ